jgi:hypothetical protein
MSNENQQKEFMKKIIADLQEFYNELKGKPSPDTLYRTVYPKFNNAGWDWEIVQQAANLMKAYMDVPKSSAFIEGRDFPSTECVKLAIRMAYAKGKADGKEEIIR